jgi:hypothetical protein
MAMTSIRFRSYYFAIIPWMIEPARHKARRAVALAILQNIDRKMV